MSNELGVMSQKSQAYYLLLITQNSETLYWIKIMVKSELVPQSKFQSMIEENEQIIKILTISINKLKEK